MAYAGIPVSIKDLFDWSAPCRLPWVVKELSAPAEADAPVVATSPRRFIVIGRTNMTEFAFCGIGIDSARRKARGGANRPRAWRCIYLGAAVSVADGMAHGGHLAPTPAGRA